MTNHTTRPRMRDGRFPANSHVDSFSEQPVGNWNRHNRRRIPSSQRTKGRIKRWLIRLPLGPYRGDLVAQQEVIDSIYADWRKTRKHGGPSCARLRAALGQATP